MALAVSLTSRPSKLRSRNACCWRGGNSRHRRLEHADRLVELEAPRGAGILARRLRDRIEVLVVLAVARRQPRHDAAAHGAAALHVADAVREDAIEQRPPFLDRTRTIRLHELHHRVLHGIERVVVVAQTRAARS